MHVNHRPRTVEIHSVVRHYGKIEKNDINFAKNLLVHTGVSYLQRLKITVINFLVYLFMYCLSLFCELLRKWLVVKIKAGQVKDHVYILYLCIHLLVIVLYQ